jgi:hypothetical protein
MENMRFIVSSTLLDMNTDRTRTERTATECTRPTITAPNSRLADAAPGATLIRVRSAPSSAVEHR